MCVFSLQGILFARLNNENNIRVIYDKEREVTNAHKILIRSLKGGLKLI
jgi:hypothetical protein